MRRAETESEEIGQLSSEHQTITPESCADAEKASEFPPFRRGRVMELTRQDEIIRQPLGNWSPALEPLLDDKQAAQFLGGIHHKTIQRMARNGEVPAYRVGRFWRYRASELNDWLRLHSTGRIACVVSRKEKP
jgi:excisionase family DNA binding protein